MLNCTACGIPTRIKHHVKHRGAGGGDEESNLMPLCFQCHTEVHMVGMLKFSSRNLKVASWLEKNGWKYDEVLNRWSRNEVVEIF